MRRIVLLVLAIALAAPVARAAVLPDWIDEAMQRPVPPGAGSAVTLHDEQIVQVPAGRRIVVTTRWAVRILSGKGVEEATVRAGYISGSSEVRSLRAWTLGANGTVLRQWNRKDASDLSDVSGLQLYTESRHLELSDPSIQPGQTFAYEVVTEEEPLFAEWRWRFRMENACAYSHFQLELPPRVEVIARGERMDSVTARHEGGVWSWEGGAQPPLPREALAPPHPNPSPSLRVLAVPGQGDSSAAGVALRSWKATAKWLAELTAPQAAITPEIQARVAATTGTTADTLERIRALALFVQSLNYVARDANLGRGWGYRPNDAAAVLRVGYGDCKDKANLLCAMIRAAGGEAWLLAVYSRNRGYVDSAWASPYQFNHCITAIRAPADYSGPLLDGGRRGRLMAFDPTDPLTAFGDLPEDQQGSWGLLVRPGDGDLVRLPVLPAEANRLERRVDAELDATGGLSAVLVERSVGQAARDERRLRRAGSDLRYKQALEAWLASQGGTVELRSWSTADDSVTGRFALRLEYRSPEFARLVAGSMLTYRGALVSPRGTWLPSDTVRTLPVALPAQCVEETLSVHIPPGYALDERPADVHVASDLGRLDATWAEHLGALVLARRWELRPLTVGADRWADVRALFIALRRSNEAMVVFVRR